MKGIFSSNFSSRAPAPLCARAASILSRDSSAEIACLREGVSVQSSGFALKTWPSDGMWLSILFFFVEFSGEAVLGCLMERLVVDENADIVENVQKRCEFGV